MTIQFIKHMLSGLQTVQGVAQHATACNRVAGWETALSILKDKPWGTCQKPTQSLAVGWLS